MYKVIAATILVLLAGSGFAQKKKHLKKGNQFYENHDYLFAERYYEKYLSGTEDMEVTKKLLHCYKAQSKNDKLNTAYKLLMADGNQAYMIEYAMFLISSEKYEDANKILDNYLSLSSNSDKELAQTLKDFSSAKSGVSNLNCTENVESKYCVEISAAKSIDPENPHMAFIWKFEDGFTKKGVTVKRCYEEPGEYTVSLSVKDNISGLVEENVNTKTFSFAPSPTFSSEDGKISIISAGEESTFKCDKASDSLTYIWDFGDHTFSTGSEVKHTFNQAKNSTIKMYILSESGELDGCVEQNVPVLYNFKSRRP